MKKYAAQFHPAKFRYQDRHLLAVSAEFHRRVGGPYSAFLFAAAGTVSADWNGLLTGWKGGGGAGVKIATSRETRPSFRLEAGLFAGEFTLRVNAGLEF